VRDAGAPGARGALASLGCCQMAHARQLERRSHRSPFDAKCLRFQSVGINGAGKKCRGVVCAGGELRGKPSASSMAAGSKCPVCLPSSVRHHHRVKSCQPRIPTCSHHRENQFLFKWQRTQRSMHPSRKSKVDPRKLTLESRPCPLPMHCQCKARCIGSGWRYIHARHLTEGRGDERGEREGLH
jgi:hypothetical protein